jgi:hypothetical protein
MNQALSKQDIEDLLSQLSEKLGQRGLKAEICLVGGAVMVLAFGSRESTHDLDGVFAPKAEVLTCVAEVGAERKLPEDWLNKGVEGFLATNSEFISDGMRQYSNLSIKRASTEYMFAMKAMSARISGFGEDKSNDSNDLEFLMKLLQLKTLDDCIKIVEKYYPSRVQPKTEYFIEETLQNVWGSKQ